jgi:hypothetical protein
MSDILRSIWLPYSDNPDFRDVVAGVADKCYNAKSEENLEELLIL